MGQEIQDLEEMWTQLCLSEEENSVIDLGTEHLGEVMKRGEKSLVGKLCSDCMIDKEEVRSTVTKIWKLGRFFSFQGISPSLFVITFENQADKCKVLEGKPRHFDNSLFILKPFDGLTPPKMSFDYEVFWIQLHNLPLMCMNCERGHQIRATIGTVKELISRVQIKSI